MQTVTVKSLEELSGVAQAILDSYTPREGAFVIALSGELGVGKTAFVKELAKHLGIGHEITSPTFVIMKSYTIPHNAHFNTLVHIDAYRIETDDEMRVLGLGAILSDASKIVCIEWPEKIADLIPKDAYPVTLVIEKGDIRTISYGS